MTKRYVLLKAHGDGPRPCAFFASVAGCRNGANCKFLHSDDQPTVGSKLAAQAPPAAAVPVTPAVAPVTGLQPPAPPSAQVHAVADGSEIDGDKEVKAKAKARKEAKKAKKAKAAAAAAAAAEAPQASTDGAPAAPAPPPAASLQTHAPEPKASPSAHTVRAAQQVLSPTKAKKQAYREKAARKAAAAAARDASAAPLEASTAAVPSAQGGQTAAPTQESDGASGVATAAMAPGPPSANAPAAHGSIGEFEPSAATTQDPKSKKKRKNKRKLAAATGGEAPTPAPNGAQAPANAAKLVAPATAQPKVASKKLCSFYNKKKGCRSGALCPFVHKSAGGPESVNTRGHAKPPALENVPVVVASEAADALPPTSLSSAPTTATQHPALAALTANNLPLLPTVVRPVPAPAASLATVPAPPRPAAIPNAIVPVAPASDSFVPAVASESGRRARKRGRSESSISNKRDGSSGTAGGRGFLEGLPVAPFVAQATPASNGDSSASSNGLAEAAAAGVADDLSEFPHEKADPWQSLVARTRAHPKYDKYYTFQSDSTWVHGAPCGDACAGLPQVVAVDCEMCMSEDPVSGERNGKELVRVSIVDGKDGQTLLDTLVRPANPVVDWRTEIHGVGPEHMPSVLFTQRHVQAALARICCQHTVMIGHSLHNDLSAMKMLHTRVVDTALIFQGEDKNCSTPSLKDVVKATLGMDIHVGSHDSVTDARFALEASKFALGKHDSHLTPIARTKSTKRTSNGAASAASAAAEQPRHKKQRKALDGGEAKEDLRALMVHRLPAGTTEEQVLRVLEKKTRVIAEKVKPVEFNGATGKTHVIYGSRALADIAFNGLSTPAQEDASGRLQKRIYISTDGKKYISVRHPMVMNDDDGGLPSLSSSSSFEEESSASDAI